MRRKASGGTCSRPSAAPTSRSTSLIRRADTAGFTRAAKANRDFKPLNLCALEYAARGITTLEEVIRLTGEVDGAQFTFDLTDGEHFVGASNGADVAVANTLVAVEAGATHVQGAANGYGDMSGNANMFSSKDGSRRANSSKAVRASSV